MLKADSKKGIHGKPRLYLGKMRFFPSCFIAKTCSFNMRMAFPHLDLLKMVGKGNTYSRNDVKFLVIGNVRGLTKSRLICEQVFGQTRT